MTFSKWLEKCLDSLSCDIDTEIYGEYIEGMLKDETLDAQEIRDSISAFLGSVIVSFCYHLIFGFIFLMLFLNVLF